MLPNIGLSFFGFSVIASIIILVTLRHAKVPRFVDWYMENWICVVISAALLLLAVALIILFLVPTDTEKVEEIAISQTFFFVELTFISVALPGLLLCTWWERKKNQGGELR